MAFLSKLYNAVGAHPGSWKAAGVPLPDWGLTERYSSNIVPQNVQRYVAPVVQRATGINIGIGAANAPSGSTLGSQTQRQELQGYPDINSNRANSGVPSTSQNVTGGGTGVNPSTQSNVFENAVSNVNAGVDDFGQLIERDYQAALGNLASQEQSLKSGADLATQQLQNEFAALQTDLNRTQGESLAGQESLLSQAGTSYKTSTQQARDLFRQIQQQNIAQLSGLGISSSSVSEALAERLGVETARRIAGATGSYNDIKQGIATEMTNIRRYYSDKLSQAEQAKTIEVGKVNQSLMAGLNQINSARYQAQSDKAQRRWQLLQDAQSRIDNIRQQELEYKTSLERWAAQKAASLQPFVTDPNLLSSYQSNIAQLNSAPEFSQFQFQPNLGINAAGAQGYFPGVLKVTKKAEDEKKPSGPEDPNWEGWNQF